jgi:hypothetical protein
MNYDEFRRHLGKAGLTNKRFAQLIGMNEKSLTNMAQKGVVPNHVAALALLMGLLADNHVPFQEQLEKEGFVKAEPRGSGFIPGKNISSK